MAVTGGKKDGDKESVKWLATIGDFSGRKECRRVGSFETVLI